MGSGMSIDLTRIIHEHFCCNRDTKIETYCGILSSRQDHIKGVDLASAVATHLTVGGLAPQTLDLLLGTGILLPGHCPSSESPVLRAGQAPPQTTAGPGTGTGTAADGRASPLGSWRLRDFATNRHE